MAAIQSIFTGKQGWGLTRNGQTHTLPKKSLYTDFALFDMDFGFVDSKHTRSLTSQPWICLFLYTCTFFSFLTITSMPSLNILVQEWGKNQTLHMNRAGQGMFSFSTQIPIKAQLVI